MKPCGHDRWLDCFCADKARRLAGSKRRAYTTDNRIRTALEARLKWQGYMSTGKTRLNPKRTQVGFATRQTQSLAGDVAYGKPLPESERANQGVLSGWPSEYTRRSAGAAY